MDLDLLISFCQTLRLTPSLHLLLSLCRTLCYYYTNALLGATALTAPLVA